MRVPGRPFCATGRRPLLEHQLSQNASQGHDREPLGLELDEEDSPGLAGHQGAKLLDAVDLGRGLGVEAQFLGLVIEREVVEVLRIDRPIEFVAQVLYQDGKDLICRSSSRWLSVWPSFIVSGTLRVPLRSDGTRRVPSWASGTRRVPDTS